MRHLPRWVLLVLPLALALLYVAAYPLVAPAPTLDEVVPGQAVVTARYRGMAALDSLWCFGRDGNLRPSEDLAERHNVAGLPGVDRSGFFHWVLLPRSGRADPTLLIVPVSDAAPLRARFDLRDGPQDPARQLRRHAKHLEVRGDFAALAWDREAVRHLGDGGLTLPDRGEDFGLAVDVKGALELALALPGAEPWHGILEALGAEPSKVAGGVDPATGMRALAFPFGRVPQVAEAWRSARMWAYEQRHEIEIELDPVDARVRRALEAAAAAPGTPIEAVVDTPAWLAVPHAAALEALARLLPAAGVAFPELAEMRGEGVLEVRATANLEARESWTLAIQAPAHAEPLLASLLGNLPGPGEALPLAAGAAPLTRATTRGAAPSPAGQVARTSNASGPSPSMLYVGADAARLAASPAPAPTRAALAPLPGQGSLLLVARLAAQPALDLLGPALQPGGILGALGPGALEVRVSTDGRLVRIRLRHIP